MRYLITHSLLNAWLWYMVYQGEDENKAYQEFKATLERKPFLDNVYMESGRNFEEDIKLYSEGLPLKPRFFTKQERRDSYYKCVREVSGMIGAGTWGCKGYQDIIIGGQDYLIYGKTDILKGPLIIDIKFTKNYQTGKFKNFPQHKVYFRCFPGVKKFIYLVSDGKDVFKEQYMREGTESIDSLISDFQSWLNSHKIEKEIYQTYWRAKK